MKDIWKYHFTLARTVKIRKTNASNKNQFKIDQ